MNDERIHHSRSALQEMIKKIIYIEREMTPDGTCNCRKKKRTPEMLICE